MPDWQSIHAVLERAGVQTRPAETARPVGGGDISAAWRLESDHGPVFMKTGPASCADMFSAEAEGLVELAAADAVRVPRVIAHGEATDSAFIALEWLSFDRPGRDTEARLGAELAELHSNTGGRFGWRRDNTIGLTPQRNDWSDSWVDFFRDYRVGFQLNLAAENGFTGALQDQGGRLMRRLPMYFEGHDPAPALLHGDLWAGNWASCNGEAVVFDPAVYYGDPETDIAMTRLFGGFGAAFYTAYDACKPPAPGHRERCDLYQLYHVLNHLNLFGSAYLARAQELIVRLIR